ncbi:SapC family protein [Psychrosphaera sp. B3R10]|uniref:SapC family protein n=1 Tax=unclassified Psychrosphaera TaxID=2641570 RepID=UPI001C089C42|nr:MULTISPECIES: SapC family protein [unclassified Psychrosphaera]MBU2880833.1 SapC family protein [Psychrosphaera sp. I2R16]MBU2990948.1 SapC family protein [Psychrosphaera sp. B3R10]MDO6720748.1 SapC family protein [Psychrosphaera sp. 1_MG-2023]
MPKQQYELVNTEAHKHLKINTQQVNVVENKVNACVVVAGELSTLVHEYPIFISKSQQTQQYQLTAILGLHSGENLYLDGEKWRAKFLPLDILRKPFHAFIPDPSKPAKGSIAIDLNSAMVNENDGQSLFEDDGNATDYYKRIETTFAQLMGGSKYSADLLQLAADLELLEQVSLDIDLPNDQKTSLTGLYVFDQEKLTALTGEKLEKCHQSGLLQVSHLVLSSSVHLQKLINWFNEK